MKDESKTIRNSGAVLWDRAKEIIPGGNQLFSKRAERYLPGYWPAYYSAAKGCEVWDLDKNHYYDFAMMGVGSCVLGYANEAVDGAVIEAIRNGGMSSLNAPEEVTLAEKLVDLHPWAQMVRYARTGGEACAVAVRIARAASGKSKVAFCGYHGWSDWYLAANVGSKGLDDQLLPGLKAAGIPQELRGTMLPFHYNRIDELERIFADHGSDVGVVMMEPIRNAQPEENFLQKVRDLATRHGAVLVFDEITAGFRETIGGIHLKYGVAPDVAVLGKALGNGYPISAVVGRREIMDIAQECFISSTFWTERVGFTAALATINEMERINAPALLTDFGNYLNQGMARAAEDAGLHMHYHGLPALQHIGFEGSQAQELQTLFTQEMLTRGFLAGTAIYMTTAYTYEILDTYIAACRDVFGLMKESSDKGDVSLRLHGAVAHANFKRLN